MSDQTAGQTIYERAQIGEVLEPFEYLITQEMLDEYRQTVGNPHAAYPTVAGRHALRAWTNRYGPAVLANVGAECEYFNPVVPGKRIRVEAKIVDKYVRRDKPYVIVDSTSVDEDGRMIEKSRLIGMAAKEDKPLFTEVQKKWETK
jgi:hypothetical protein